jgi:hypothetical protein
LRVIKPLLIVYYLFSLKKWFSHIFRFCLSFIILSVLFYFCRSVDLFVLILCLGTLVVLIFRYGTKFVLIFCLGTIFVLFRFTYLFRSKFGADPVTYFANPNVWLFLTFEFCHINCNFIIIPFYSINTSVMSLLTDSFLLIFSKCVYIII